MSTPTTAFIPFKMEGSGNFSERVSYTRRIFEQFVPFILDAIADVVSSSARPFTIADYGTADGGASYNAIRGCVGIMRRRFGETLPIQVLYEDQPVNNFKSVFLRSNGLLPNTRGLNEEFGNVFIIASGTSFYQQCVPDNTLDFIISSTAMHWLSQSPLEIPTELYWEFASGPVREAFRKQAESDLKNFLTLRQKELKPGGRMVLMNMIDEDQGFYRTLAGVMRSLLNENTITEAEFQNTNFAFYLRRLDEWKEAIKEMPLLRVVSHHIRDIELVARFDINVEPESVSRRYEVLLTEVFRSWSEQMVYSGLSNERSDDEKRETLDIIYRRYLEALCCLTKPLNNSISMLCLVVEKLEH